jgi:transposase-like protein
MPGRPKYRSDLEALQAIPEDMIWSLLEQGRTITQVCYEIGVGKKALQDWLNEVDPDDSKITRARAKAATNYAMQALEIADSSEPEQAAKARLQIQTRQWIAERWDRKTYGTQSGPQITLNITDLRLNALRHAEVIEDLSTDAVPKLSTN